MAEPMSTSGIAAPRSSSRSRSLKGGGRNRSGQTNFELYSWLFMRLSGLALVVLVLGHLFVNLMLGGGITALDFGFVAGKWANPLWQVWDLLMLWLAMLHGSNGLRTIVIVVLGTLVIFTFDPCLDPNSTLSVCK
jgi:succinate dehydrogenase / fumarate reductase membrane anchor subunit